MLEHNQCTPVDLELEDHIIVTRAVVVTHNAYMSTRGSSYYRTFS